MQAKGGLSWEHGFVLGGYGLVGGAITRTLGALVGLAIKTDRWVRVQEAVAGCATYFVVRPLPPVDPVTGHSYRE
jgi:hypothetical protein